MVKIIPSLLKKCSLCGIEIKEYDTKVNVDYHGFLHCNNCLIHCKTFAEWEKEIKGDKMTKISYSFIGMEICLAGAGVELIFHNYSAMIAWGIAAMWAYIAYCWEQNANRLEKLLDNIVGDLRKIIQDTESRKLL